MSKKNLPNKNVVNNKVGKFAFHLDELCSQNMRDASVIFYGLEIKEAKGEEIKLDEKDKERIENILDSIKSIEKFATTLKEKFDV